MLEKIRAYFRNRGAQLRLRRKCTNLRSILPHMISQRDFYTAEANKYGNYKDHEKAVKLGEEIQAVINFLVDSYEVI